MAFVKEKLIQGLKTRIENQTTKSTGGSPLNALFCAADVRDLRLSAHSSSPEHAVLSHASNQDQMNENKRLHLCSGLLDLVALTAISCLSIKAVHDLLPSVHSVCCIYPYLSIG